MQMKKFIATTAREAMRKMKADLGPEAYVISNRTIAQGVEILAMAGSALEHLTRSGQASPPMTRGALRPASGAYEANSAAAEPFGGPAPFKTLRDIAPRLHDTTRIAAKPPEAARSSATLPALSPFSTVPMAPAPSFGASAAASPAMPVNAGVAGTTSTTGMTGPTGPTVTSNEQRLLDEFKSMKALLDQRLSEIAGERIAPQRKPMDKLWRELTAAGYSPAVVSSLRARLPGDLSEPAARQWMRDVLTHNLACTASHQDLVSQGGVYALVGPTGVGKTTTVAKLAARCVVKYGAAALGLITTDGYRIGAFDQLEIYGRILGVTVHAAQSAADLAAVLATLRGKRLVLIDTVGMGQRDTRLGEQLALLAVPEVRRVLLLNAAAQAGTLDDVARAYGATPAGSATLGATAGPIAAILTKLDEAVKLAPVLDTCMRHRLEIQYITSGQRVPEDIHPASAQALVHRALHAQPKSALDQAMEEEPGDLDGIDPLIPAAAIAAAVPGARQPAARGI